MSDTLTMMQEDFKFFLSCIWHQLGLPSPTKAQLAMADYMQHGPKRLQIQGFRGLGKSWIAGAFALWTLFNDQEKKILIVSASKERADNQSIFIQKLILDTPWLQHLKPDTLDSTARWSRISFDVKCAPAQSPSVKSVGITGQLTGSRGDLVLLDDVEIPNNSMTEMQREKLLQLVTEVEAVLTPKPDSRILFLGTPQTTFTIYRKLAERNYRPWVWPARYPKSITGYEGLLAPQVQAAIETGAKPWDPTDPMRFSDEELLEREVSMGRSNFLLQYMLDTSLSDAEKFPLKFSDLIVMPVNPTKAPDSLVWCSDPRNILKELPAVGLPGDRFYSPMVIQGDWDDYQETIVSVDPSGRGRDETAAAFLSQRHGYIYLHEMFSTKDGYSDDTILAILRRCKKYNVSTILIESNFGDGIVCELFRKHLQQTKQHIKIEETRATVRKEDRIIDTLEPVMNQHRLVVDTNVIIDDYQSNPDAAPEDRLLYMLFYQMSRICREKGAIRFDDRLDALSQGVQYFTTYLSLSAHEAVAARKHEEWQASIDEWLDDPQSACNHLVLGMGLDQRRRARSLSGATSGLVFAGGRRK